MARHAHGPYARLLADHPSPELELEYGRVLSWMGASNAAVDRLTSAYRANRTEEAVLALANARAWSGEREAAIRMASLRREADERWHLH